MVFRSSQPGENNAENSNSERPSFRGADHGQATYRRVRIESEFGKAVVLVTDGHLPWPYGRELTGYEVSSVSNTLAKAANTGGSVLVAPYTVDHREAAIVQFLGGYIAEIHASAPP
jgi:peptidoglycan/xylan/chitin deacetylase (PgdA/CDA1 family)